MMRRPALAFLVLVAVAAFAFAAEERVLDDFDRLSGWKASASDDAAVTVSPDEGAMRIDFAFPPVGGYVTVHKEFAVELPENWAFTFRLRGEAPDNHLEFKLIDPGAKNVWRRTYRDLHFPRDWEEMTVQKARVDLAWGKASGGKPTRVAALEIAISTGSGGRGSVWIDDLRFEERAPASQYYRTLEVKASSALPGHDPGNVLDGDPASGWKSAGGRREQWLQIDLLRDQEYGGLIIDWDPEDYATSYQVQVSEDGEEWAVAYLSTWGNGGRDYVYMPDAHSRYLRLVMQSSSRGEGYGINAIQIEPFEFSRTPNDFFQAIAQDAPPGTFPKYFYGVQPYWTVVGAPGDDKEALLSDDGVLEIEKESFTIEPFLFADAKLLGSSAVETRPSLEGGRLPIPSVNWRNEKVGLTVTAFAAGEAGASTLYARYRVESRSEVAQRVTLYLAVRPFQVVPPWQSLNMAGGVSPISELSSEGRTVWVNRSTSIVPLTPGGRFGATGFERGSITDFLLADRLPEETDVADPLGFASGALAWGIDLPPGGNVDVSLAIPFHERGPVVPAADPAYRSDAFDRRLAETESRWRTMLDHVDLDLPPDAERIVRAVDSSLAYIHINRDGPRIQPGSRSYARSWIRDGVLTASALLQMAYTREPRDFLEWYAQFQFDDGRIPCCVDEGGADRVPENDSDGEFIYGVMEVYRYTHDVGFVREMWPHVVRAVDHLKALRAQRTTAAYRTPEKEAFFGLVPESISHEGYSERPVHSYWDDFFALRGLKDAARLAIVMADSDRAKELAKLRDDFRDDLYRSIARTIEKHRVDYLPASVELGDFDPNSTAIAIEPGGEMQNLPAKALRRTYDEYYEFFRRRRSGEEEWNSLTPYEVRNVGIFVRLGERERAHEILDFLLANQRPEPWNEWQEILWRDPRSPRFIGDMPHTWVAAGFVRSVRAMLAYERESDEALVLAAGVPEAWVSGGKHVGVKRLPTYFGVLSYTLESERPGSLTLRMSGDLEVPPGGIVLRPPLSRPIAAVRVNGKAVKTFSADQAVVSEFPAEVVMELAPAKSASKRR